MNDQQRYLNEHLPYMLKMVRYAGSELHKEQFYLAWNSHFESFAVNARNLVNFLTNGDTGNFKAVDFVPDFRSRIGDLSGPMGKLREQVFHLSKRRPTEAELKFGSESADEVRSWIENEMADFLAKLALTNAVLANFWDEKKAVPELRPSEIGLGPTGASAPQSACTASPGVAMNQTETTAVSGVTFHRIG
jgi:hypothetical protein